MQESQSNLQSELEKIPERLFYRIGDVAEILKVKPYVIRYWESEFKDLAPHKNPSGQRLYRKKDVEKILIIRYLLHKERYSLEGAKKRLREMKKKGDFNIIPNNSPSSKNNPTPKTEILEKIKELKFLVKTPVSEFFSL